MAPQSALILVVGVLLAAGPSPAEIVVIPLEPGETPLVLEAGVGYALPFDLGRPLTDIAQVGLRLVGSETYYRDYCWTDGDFEAGQWWHRDVLGLAAALMDDGAPRAEAVLAWQPQDHPQDLGVNLDTVVILQAGDWSFLADGAAEVVLQGLGCTYAPLPPEVCDCDPSFTLMRLELVVATDGSLPAGPAAWGALKARYR